MCNRYQQAAIQEAKDVLDAIIETPFNVGSDIIHPQSPGCQPAHKADPLLASKIDPAMVIFRGCLVEAMAVGVGCDGGGRSPEPLHPTPVAAFVVGQIRRLRGF